MTCKGGECGGECGGEWGADPCDAIPDVECEARQGCDGCRADEEHARRRAVHGGIKVRPPWAVIGETVGLLVAEKQKAYGDSFGRSGVVLQALYPKGIALAQLDDALTVIRVVDKLFRVATDRDALGESPWRDIAGYALLSVERVERAGSEVQKPFNPQ